LEVGGQRLEAKKMEIDAGSPVVVYFASREALNHFRFGAKRSSNL